MAIMGWDTVLFLGAGIEKFRRPFEGQLASLRAQLDFPSDGADAEAGMARLDEQLALLDGSKLGAVLVEPIQGRGGKVVPPDGFLAKLRAWCDANEALLIYDEIYTGLNRTGKLFACDWEGVVPDIICIGKSLSGGYPISACVGKASVMDAWPKSEGEALHTSTFLGNPVGCAMAVASLKEHAKQQAADEVIAKARVLKGLLEGLASPLIYQLRGRGLMIGVELRHADGRAAGDVAGQVLSDMLARGIFMLADGAEGNVLAFTPPFVISEEEMHYAVNQLQSALDR